MDQNKADFLNFSQTNSSPARRGSLFNGLYWYWGSESGFVVPFKVIPHLLYQIYLINHSVPFYSHPSHIAFPVSKSIPVLFLRLSTSSNPSSSFETSRHVSIPFFRFLPLSFSLPAHMFINLSPFLRKPQGPLFLYPFFYYSFKEAVYGSFSDSFSCLYVEDKAGLLSLLSVWWVSDCPSVWDVAAYCVNVFRARGLLSSSARAASIDAWRFFEHDWRLSQRVATPRSVLKLCGTVNDHLSTLHRLPYLRAVAPNLQLLFTELY